jgi:hypothetical protein
MSQVNPILGGRYEADTYNSIERDEFFIWNSDSPPFPFFDFPEMEILSQSIQMILNFLSVL